jgi:hypothetical protein
MNALNHKGVSTIRKVYAHSARSAEGEARELGHARMFAHNVEAPKVIKLDKSEHSIKLVVAR